MPVSGKDVTAYVDANEWLSEKLRVRFVFDDDYSSFLISHRSGKNDRKTVSRR